MASRETPFRFVVRDTDTAETAIYHATFRGPEH